MRLDKSLCCILIITRNAFVWSFVNWWKSLNNVPARQKIRNDIPKGILY